jgi:hypothetical protein
MRFRTFGTKTLLARFFNNEPSVHPVLGNLGERIHMFSNTKNLVMTTAIGVALVATTASAMDLQDVSEINVTASYSAAEGTNAQALFPEIATDIQLAIAKLVPVSTNANDPVIRADIRKVALNGDTILPDSLEFNQLEGIVAIETSNGADSRTFPIRIQAKTADTVAPEGYTLASPSVEDFYNAMVAQFAINVDEGLEKVSE